MSELQLPKSKEDYIKLDRYYRNLTTQGKIQFDKVGETIEGQAYLLKQAIEFDKLYPQGWTGISDYDEQE